MKSGYKQTEIGVLPDDWQVKPLCSLSTEISDGIHSTPDYVRSSDYYFINGNNLVNNRISITDSTMCVSELEYKSLRKDLTDRTLFLSINGTIGNLAFYKGEQVVLGKSAAYINVAKSASKTFIFYCLKSRPTSLFFESDLTGTTIRNLSLQSLRDTPIPLPPTIQEQRAIAEALKDGDELIGALEQLIAKKRDLKKAAMQKLLTGQIRLPRFTGEWVTKLLGDVAYIKTGSRNNEDKIEDGQYPFFVRSQFVERINSYSYDCEAILVPGEGQIGNIFHYIHGRFDTHQRVYVIRQFKPNISARFIYFYLLKNFGAWAMQNTVKATVDSLRLPTFQTFEMRLPPTLDEQVAIAEVLSDMDADFAALEQRLVKTRDLKQGMMQELLTGRTRLV